MLAMSQAAFAAEGTGTTTTTTASSGRGEIAASAGIDVTGGPAPSSATASKPRCGWEVYTDLLKVMVPQLGPGVLQPMRRDSATHGFLPGGSPASQATETLYKRTCPGAAGFTLSWVPDGVNVDDVLASAVQRVTAQIPAPALNMNPDPAVGGVVNIGLWLAVADPGQVSITASVGPVWATVTARYQRTSWSLGNGDVVECEGLGTPIVDVNTEEQGPCGYTYRWPSAPRFTGAGDLAYHNSVTGHWVVAFATSTGASGSLAPIDRTTAFTYRVREIQTVRVGEGD